MRFLIDDSLPRTVGLAGAGHDVVDVRDVGLRGATDDAVAAHAKAEARIIVSADLDFSNALRFAPRTHPGIVVARLADTAAPAAIAARLLDAITEAGAALDGAITVVDATRVRIFRGP